MWLFYYILISFLAFHKKPGILHFIESLKNICFHLQSSKTIVIFVIVWGILFDYQRIIFNSHENGQWIRKCQTVQNHYIPHAFK